MVIIKPPKKYIRTAADRRAVDEGAVWDTSDFDLFQSWCSEFAIQSQGEWSGKPLELLDYQIDDIFKPLLSWKKPDGSYLKNLGLIFSSKKIGKTTSIAALCGWKACCFQDQQIFVIASKVEQARICFETIREFTRHPELRKRWHVKEHLNTIIDRESGSRIKVLACNPSGISGFSADLFILDETAEMPSNAAQIIWDRIEFAGAAKPNSQIISITTPAHNLNHLGYRLYQRCNNLLSGQDDQDTATLPVVYGVPSDADWTDESEWRKLPHIGKTVSLDFYKTQYRRAKGDPHEEMSFRIYLLGQYVRNKNVFVDMHAWSQCSNNNYPELSGCKAALGFDNGGANDFFSISCLVPHEDKIYLETKAALTTGALHKKNKTGQTHFQAWANQGLIEVFDAETISFDNALKLLEEFYDRYDVRALAYDPWQLQDLQDAYLKKGRLTIETPQFGKYLSPLILDFERKIKEQTLQHNNDVVLNFCVENFQVKENKFGKLEFNKENSRTKNDLACSTVVALNALPEAYREAPVWSGPPVLAL